MHTYFSSRSLFSLFFLLSSFFFSPSFTYAATADLSITANNIQFSKDVLYVGDTVRIYATVRNNSETDIAAKVIFYQGAVLIGSSQTISVLAGGGSDDVYVDYRVPAGTFNIRAVIQGQNPQDQNTSNDEAITGLLVSISDSDRDDIVDEEDNCKEERNTDQADQDRDGVGDVCDSDRDGDGVKNSSDAYPDDASLSADPDAVIESVPEEAPQEIVDPAPIVPDALVYTDAEPPEVTYQETGPEAVAETTLELPSENPGIFGFGTLSISPYAQFSYRQIDWRTYEFTALPSEGQGEITYGWDFGDGATSVQRTLVHAFPNAGQFVVTLAVLDEAGNVVSDAETFDISFFHLHNPWIQATLAALFFVLLGLMWLLVRMKESKEIASEEV